MSLFAGVDGGASKTRARVVDASGALVGEGSAGPGSLSISAEQTALNARAAVCQALEGSGHTFADCRLVAGLAGHRQPEKRLIFAERLQEAAALEVISDGYAALLGAHGGAPGAIVIVGTGSVGLGLDGAGMIHQVGGWGPVVGDEGSGNWLARKAVRQALRADDRHAVTKAPVSPLLAAIYQELGGSHEAALAWLDGADATRFGGLMPLIRAHDEAGDPTARALLADAAKEAGRLIRLAGLDGRLPVALLGGLAATLKPRIDPSLILVAPAADALDGALHRARGLAPPECYIDQAA
jgi:glucosamine kinase